MRKAELVALLQNNAPPSRSGGPRAAAPTPEMRPPPPPPQRTAVYVTLKFDDNGCCRMRKAELVAVLCESLGGGLRTPTQQEMDIFKQQEMNRSWPQVTSKLNKWYNWLVNHIPKPIKDGASGAFRTLKERLTGCIIGLLVSPCPALAKK